MQGVIELAVARLRGNGPDFSNHDTAGIKRDGRVGALVGIDPGGDHVMRFLSVAGAGNTAAAT
ncbi:MAG TPA: hypothetical protein VGG23_09475, partial [Acidimicrobiales bacterium]